MRERSQITEHSFQHVQDDNGGTFPLGGFKFVDGDFTSEWQNAIYRYVKNDSVYRCPETICKNITAAEPGSYGEDASKPRTPVTYLYNGYLGAVFANARAITPAPHPDSEVVSPTKCILLMEGNVGLSGGTTMKGVDGRGRQHTLWLREYTFYLSAAPMTGGESNPHSYGLPHHADGGNFSPWTGTFVMRNTPIGPRCRRRCPG